MNISLKKIFIPIFLLAFTLNISAQIEVVEGSKSMLEGRFNAYTVTLINIQKDNAEDAWKDFMKEFKAKVNKDKKAKLHVSENVQIPSISSNPVDIFASIEESKGKSTTVSIWFDTGSGYVNSIDMPAQSEVALSLVEEYASNVMRNYTGKILKEEEDKLKDLSNDAKKLKDKNKDLRDDIAKAKANILKWEKELEQNEDNIKKKEKAIDQQKVAVESAQVERQKFN